MIFSISEIWSLLQICYRQLWYLTGDMIAMALVATWLPDSEREELAKAIHSVAKPEKPRMGKPNFHSINGNQF